MIRPREFEVDNGEGIKPDIRIDPESLREGELYFEIEQDTDTIIVNLACLRGLVQAAEELTKARRAEQVLHDAVVGGLGIMRGDERIAPATIYKEVKRWEPPDPSRCPQCRGPADNGHDRTIPPNPYLCTKCMAKSDMK